MRAIPSIVASSVVSLVCACSGTGATGTSPEGGTAPGNVNKGAETAPDDNKTPSTLTPTGKSCSSADDCAYYYCKCSDGAVVNSRMCSQNVCQGAAAHCTTACTTFHHGAWTGTYGGGDTTTPPTTKDAGKTDPRAGSCTSKDQCAPYQCGCTDGSRITVRECFNSVCQDSQSGCQSACSDDGRGDWDGT